MNEADYKKVLTDYIDKRLNISEEEKEIIASSYTLKSFQKKEHIFTQGKPCSIETFVVKGTLRLYHVDNKGQEHVLLFAFPEWWVGDMASFNTGEPSSLTLQVLEETIALVIDPTEKEVLLKKVPKLERLFRLMIQKNLSVLQKRFLLTISANASDRYLELIERSPGIEQLVPQHQIASYLGIHPESLSRMKKQLLK
jgi:CRP-like cAMP-binding protein